VFANLISISSSLYHAHTRTARKQNSSGTVGRGTKTNEDHQMNCEYRWLYWVEVWSTCRTVNRPSGDILSRMS